MSNEHSPFLISYGNFFFYRSVRMLVGGRVRAILSGGAPLSEDTHDYLRNVLGVILLQAECLMGFSGIERLTVQGGEPTKLED